MSLDAIDLVLKRSHSAGAARLVLIVLAHHADRKTGESYASRRTLAIECNVSTATIHAALGELLNAGEIEIVMTGSGRKATTYRICSDSISKPLQPVDNSVAAQLRDRSGSICETVAAQSARPSIGRTEDLNKIELTNAAAPSAPTDPPADAVGRRSASSNGVPADAATRLAALKADLTAKATAERQAEAQRLRDLLGPPASEPARSVARPVSAAAANAQQAAPDTAAKTPRRTARGRKGHRGREPPATCTRSTTAATRPRRPDDGCRTAQCPARP